MRSRDLLAVLLCAAQVFAWGVLPVRAQDPKAQPSPESAAPATASPSPPQAEPSQAAETPAAEVPATPPDAASAPVAPVPADPVVTVIRTKLADPANRKDANAEDLSALEAFYAARSTPLWMTEMGFSAKGQEVLFEIEKGGEWGLDPSAFDLPPAGALPEGPEAQGLAEIKLGLAILKYARFARGGRLVPREIHEKLDQEPSLRDPKEVLAEIAVADAPDAYLQSLHPEHEQFVRLRQALLEARIKAKENGAAKDSERDIKRLILNMERWRWMPEDLGKLYVQSNTPEFMLRVVKDGKTIYSDKILVGTITYATPVFSADLKTIVFNPEWVAPPTVLVEDLWPSLRQKDYSVIRKHKLFVSYQGRAIDPAKVDWRRVNIRSFTFRQKPGPHNNLGKVKFLYPNEHTVYMHDTLPVRRKHFKEPVRAIGHDCVRMEQPDKFAEVLLAEDQDMPASKIRELWDKSVNEAVVIEGHIPVHMTYFTVVADEEGKVSTYPDLYGFDHKLAKAVFGDAAGFPMPPPERKRPQVANTRSSRTAGNDFMGALQGFFSD